MPSACSRTKHSTVKLSPDPLLVEKVIDIVGSYMNPPEQAVVLFVDEKNQIQALDRTAVAVSAAEACRTPLHHLAVCRT